MLLLLIKIILNFLKDAEKNGIKFDIIFLDPPYDFDISKMQLS